MSILDTEIEIIEKENLPYLQSLGWQQQLVDERKKGQAPDRLLIVTHPPVITIGKSGGAADLTLSEQMLKNKGVEVCKTDRGGKATFHGPGQLVCYPIIKLKEQDVHLFVAMLLEVISSVLKDFDLVPSYQEGKPGVWVNGKKIASIGISVKNWISSHGIALNVNTDMSYFDLFVPCGVPGQPFTSMEKELGHPQNFNHVKQSFVRHFKKTFQYADSPHRKHPEWLRTPLPKSDEIKKVHTLVTDLGLQTVCQSAKCPNLGECFGNGTATFMILGNQCTRNCRYCAVEKGAPKKPDPEEPNRVARAINKLGLTYAVITSVTRDDLEDGGASQFVRTISHIREICPETGIEILVPDFKGNIEAIQAVCSAKPDMFNHNLETVSRLFVDIRPQAIYSRSLFVLEKASNAGLPVKSGLMLGLGESEHEIKKTLKDLLSCGCRYLTLGQYLSPSKNHVPVARFLTPEEFEDWYEYALSLGFREVVSGPLVRSSYKADVSFHKHYLK